MSTLADLVARLTPQELDDFICRHDPAAWAERKRGFRNAPFHNEWYSLIPKASRQAIVAPREHAKTECVTINGTAWRCIYQPGIWTYIFAATDDQAKEIKARIDTALEETAPHLVVNAESINKNGSVYANHSRVSVAGAGKAVRGAHPDVIVGDDVLEEESALTEYQRKKTNRWWFGTIGGMAHPGTTRMIRGRGRVSFRPTQVFLVGTPFHSQDLLMSMRSNPLWAFRRYAAEFHPDQLVPGTYAVEVTGGASQETPGLPAGTAAGS